MDLAWLQKIQRKKGRPLRVLHVGNIANNAYFNAKFLNSIGVQADVFCYGNYHIMSCPEWEEAEFTKLPKDMYFPDWWNLDIKGYERPRWFVQGPWELCIQYLIAKLDGNQVLADSLWLQLEQARRNAHIAPYRMVFQFARRFSRFVPDQMFSHIRSALQSAIEYMLYRSSGRRHTQSNSYGRHDKACAQSSFERLSMEFSNCFPARSDKLTLNDIRPFLARSESVGELFRHYDIVQAYATDVIYPLLSNFRPYVGFEHGTLRTAPDVTWSYKGPFYNNSLGRLTALGYARADHVFVTNADNHESARQLGITNMSPIGHPFDERVFTPNEEYRRSIRAGIGADYLFLCPLRHDWLEKGTDIYIRVLPKLRAKLGTCFKVFFMPWGKEVDSSRKLIAGLGCEDLVAWVGPFCQTWFSRWLAASDIIFDQLVYASFSGLSPRALACGVPVVGRYDPGRMAWMFPEPAPVLNATTEDEVFAQVIKALEPGFRKRYQVEAPAWIKRHHSADQTLTSLLEVYQRLMS